ncbi:uncharacterized protein LOC135431770 [Drosophila montana]|uniref:uncharacterized protein LOC135431770 n=1 Tax=Drosophila montana TaxID=40370 RepID=UPI00313DE1AE
MELIYSELFDDIEVFENRAIQYPYIQHSPPEPTIRKPNESFYIHLQDAVQEQWPAFVMAYRRKFNAKTMEQRHKRAEELRKQLTNQRVDRLSGRLANVALLTADYHAKRNNSWLALRDHSVQDMQKHLHRHELKLMVRVRQLRAHNSQVQKRSELLRYRNYLTRIALQHEEKRKRIGIF